MNKNYQVPKRNNQFSETLKKKVRKTGRKKIIHCQACCRNMESIVCNMINHLRIGNNGCVKNRHYSQDYSLHDACQSRCSNVTKCYQQIKKNELSDNYRHSNTVATSVDKKSKNCEESLMRKYCNEMCKMLKMGDSVLVT